MCLLVGALAFYACREQAIVPVAAFDYALADASMARVPSVYPTHVALKAINESTHGSSYRWDFGNGITSTEREPTFDYAKSGNYTITLTVNSASGESRAITKRISIVDRVLKKVVLQSLAWNAMGELPAWSDNKSAGVRIAIGNGSAGSAPLSVTALLYQSDLLENVSPATAPIELSVPGTRIINPLDLASLIINLYGVDDTGQYLSYSSRGSGFGVSSYMDRDTGRWIIRTGGVGTLIQLECDYE